MITPDIIKIVYVLSLIVWNLFLLAAVIGGVVGMVIYSDQADIGNTMLLLGIAVDIVAGIIISVMSNLLLRMFCEQIILFFSIHEVLSSIEDIERQRDKSSRKSALANTRSTREKKEQSTEVKAGPQ